MAFKDKETGKWVAQWYEPNVYGVNKQKKKRGFKTQREAKQYECDRNLKKQGNLQMSMKVFVEQYFQDKEACPTNETSLFNFLCVTLKLLLSLAISLTSLSFRNGFFLNLP